MQDADIIIFVVDAADNRMDEAKTELHKYIIQRPESAGMALLVLANKQDLPGAISNAELVDALELRALKRPWHIIVSHVGSADFKMLRLCCGCSGRRR
jgi:signal recognition particle receptor subunit beta